MIDFIEANYAISAFLLGVVLAQASKPIFLLLIKKKWNPNLALESGGFPSSHTSGVASLCISIGLREGFDSNLFGAILAISTIIAYDAANVRYYAGQHIQMTKRLIQDIQELTETKFDDPIYLTRLKNVLGHKWIEVFGGLIFGLLVGYILYIIGGN